jgi:hypothetical protein
MAPLIQIAISLAQQFLPSLVSKVAGDKSGKVAQQVVDVAADLTGMPIHSATDAEAAAAAMRKNPELAVQFQTRMAELELETTRAYLADRQDARSRDIALRESGDDNRRANWMIVGDVIGLVACLVMLYLIKDLNGAGEIRGIISTIAGFFGLGLRDAHQFEFGSSRGSKQKDALIGGGGG